MCDNWGIRYPNVSLFLLERVNFYLLSEYIINHKKIYISQ